MRDQLCLKREWWGTGPGCWPHVTPPPPPILSSPGLQDAVWLGRTQVLQHGPVTWYIDGAHTTSSVQACVRWFHQAALNEEKPVE